MTMAQQGGEEGRFRFHPNAHGQYPARGQTSVGGTVHESGD